MGFAVAHIEDAGRVDKHAMRARQRAAKRIRLGAVAALTGAKHGRDDAGLELDAANDVVLGVGDVEVAASDSASPLGPPSLADARRPAVSRIALLAGASDMVNRRGAGRDAINRVALAQREVERAVTIDGDACAVR